MTFATWSQTAASNTAVGGISTDGNITLVNQIDNMFRGMMAELAVARDDGTIITAPVLKAIKRITSSQTYDTPTGVYALWIRAVGGGGGGAGAPATGGNPFAGSGGGAGSYGEIYVTAPAASYAITIGAAGTAGAGTAATTGGTGGTTTVGSILELGGGSGGTIITTASVFIFAAGGNGGGVVTGGDRFHNGEMGGYALRTATNSHLGGQGGSGPFGTGGNARILNSAIAATGIDGFGFGAGGGGAISASGDNRAGGAGTAGYVEIWEFI